MKRSLSLLIQFIPLFIFSSHSEPLTHTRLKNNELVSRNEKTARRFFADTKLLTISQLRNFRAPQPNCLYKTIDYGGGEWYYDRTDNKSKDNIGTIIVNYDGKRFKRIYDDVVSVSWFGIKGDGTDETTKLQNAVNSSHNKTLKFDGSKTYLIGGGYNHHVLITGGDITLDGNGCTINPFNKGGGEVFFIFNSSASVTNPVSIQNVTFKNFNYDAKYGPTMFINSLSKPYQQLGDITIIANHFKNFSGFNNGVITLAGPAYIKPDSSGIKVVKNLLIKNNSFLNFGKFLGTVVNKDYTNGAKSLLVSTLDKTATLRDHIQIGGYFRIASAEDTLKSPAIYLGTNAIYKVTGYDSLSSNTAIIHITSGTYTNQQGYNVDAVNQGLLAPIKKNASILPIIRWTNQTLSFCPQFNFTPGSNIATRSSQTKDENNRSKNLLAGAEFYISGVADKTYKIISIDNEKGDITLDKPFSTEIPKQNNKAIILTGSLGNMVSIGGNMQVTVDHNLMVGGERAVAGFIPVMLGTTIDDNNTVLKISNNYIKALYFPVEFGNYFLYYTELSYDMVQNNNFFTIKNPSAFKYVSKDINGDGVAESLLVPSGVPAVSATYSNSFIEGDIIRFAGKRGIYIITKIPTDFDVNPQVEISRYDDDKHKAISGGFMNSFSGEDDVTAYENVPLKIDRQWKNLIIAHNTIQDSYSSLLSIGCNNTHITGNTLNGTQNMTFELNCVNAVIDSNKFTNTRWTGDINRIGVSGSWLGIDLRGPLLNSTSNLYFANNVVTTIDAKMGPMAGQNSFTYVASNPGKQIFENNVFNGVSGPLFKPQQMTKINGNQYSLRSYYKLFSFKNNIVNITLANNGSSFMYPLADQTEIVGNTFNFLNGKSYDKILATETPNPLMYPDDKSFKIIISDNKIINSNKNTSDKAFWGSHFAIIK